MEPPIKEVEKSLAERWVSLNRRHLEHFELEKQLMNEARDAEGTAAEEEVRNKCKEAVAKRKELYLEREELVQEGCDFTLRVTKGFHTRKQVIEDYKRKLEAVWVDGPGDHGCKFVDPWHIPAGFIPTEAEGEYLYCFMDPVGTRSEPQIIPINYVQFIEHPAMLW